MATYVEILEVFAEAQTLATGTEEVVRVEQTARPRKHCIVAGCARVRRPYGKRGLCWPCEIAGERGLEWNQRPVIRGHVVLPAGNPRPRAPHGAFRTLNKRKA